MTGATGGRTDIVLLASLYVLEGSLAAVAVGAHLGGTRGGGLLVIGGIAGTAAAVTILRRARRSTAFGMTLAMNLFTVALALAAAEIALRTIATREPHGTFVAGRLLPPRRWDDVAAWNLGLLAKRPSNISYFVADPRLGWTVGPSRRSSDGLYASSAEGIRSATPDAVFASSRPARRIALVGDSYAFGLEVPFEQSWGHLLEGRLGAGTQVLNFGVDGYGVDQAYLRYLGDVRPFAPDVVIFAFIHHDLDRTMAVYDFIDFPTWGFPFAKPRFVLDAAGHLVLANAPLPEPERLFAARSIELLPHLELDAGYRAEEWRPRWYAGSYAIRWLLSSSSSGPSQTAATIALNSELIAEGVREIRTAGSVPVVAFFPSRYEFRHRGRGPSEVSALIETLRGRGVTVVDLTPCLAPTGEDALFLPGRPHYGPVGNAEVARCLEPVVRDAFGPN